MKKMSLFLCLLGMFSCAKQSGTTAPEPVGSKLFQSRTQVHTEAVEYYQSCPDLATGIDPVVYTGPQDPQTQTAPGYGFNPNDNYDRGWADGYRDALFYQNYIGTDPLIVCSYNVQRGVYDAATAGLIRWVADSYQLKPGETWVAPRMSTNCHDETWALKKCVLNHAASSRALLLQYQFNSTYPGRTQAQKDYDTGRLAGYKTGINTQPFSF